MKVSTGLCTFFYPLECTLINFYTFFFMKGTIHSDFTFEWLDYNHSGNVITKTYAGSWLIVDNGYLKWPTSVPPYKVTADEKERKWSHWLESLQKDMECKFGNLKGVYISVALKGLIKFGKPAVHCTTGSLRWMALTESGMVALVYMMHGM